MTSVKRRAADAGMTLVRGDVDHLGSPVAAAPILAPSVVEVDRGQVVYGFVAAGDGYEPPRWVDPASRDAHCLLDDFVGLADRESADDAVVRVVREWGALGLCRHHLPLGHNPRSQFSIVMGMQGEAWWCLPLGYGDARFQSEMNKRHGAEVAQWGYEPISRWRDFAVSASALMLVAAALHNGTAPAPEDMHRAFSFWFLPDPPPTERRPPDYAWRLVADAVSGWLSMAGVTVSATPRREGDRMSLDTRWVTGWEPQRHTGASSQAGAYPLTGQVFGVLAIQLMLRVSRARDVGVCAWCRRPFLSAGRRLRPDRRHFCHQCQQEGKPDLMAQQDKRDRDRQRREEGEP